MVHTLPDYSTKYKLATIFSHIDEAELAARLFSIVTFDRRGNIVWMDDMEHGAAKWATAFLGVGGSVAIGALAARNGDNSMKLTTGSTLTFEASMSRLLQLPVTGRLGLEISFTFDTNMARLRMNLFINVDGTMYTATINFSHTGGNIQYRNSAGAEVELLPAVTFTHEIYYFQTAKIVIDYTAKEYVRFMFGERSVDMSGFSLSSGATSNPNSINIALVATGTNGNNAVCYIDDVILTQNEP